ncbi:MAG: MGMT family protein [Nanoarchaeota archaeon]
MNFSEKVYKVISRIPRGKVSTYKAVAQALNCKAYRAVGNALNKNPYASHLVPCHRVIKANCEIGGFASGTRNKIKMLKKEGVVIKNSKIDLQKYFYQLR